MNQVQTTPPPGGLPSIIERAAGDPNFDLDKLQRLIDMHELAEQRTAERIFNTALVDAEAEMRSVSADSNNPQTRSKYASYAALDNAIRPHYTRFGLGVSFNTEPAGVDVLRVIGTLSHREGGSRRFQIDMPIDTKGARGGDVMTRTHATGSAYTYGKRYLLLGMFNLSVDEDTDGNTPRQPPMTAQSRRQAPPPQEYTDPVTGEVTDQPPHETPAMITMGDQEVWQSWVPRFMQSLKTSSNLDEVQQWQDLNTSTLRRLEKEKPPTHAGVLSAIGAFKKTFQETSA